MVILPFSDVIFAGFSDEYLAIFQCPPHTILLLILTSFTYMFFL